MRGRLDPRVQAALAGTLLVACMPAHGVSSGAGYQSPVAACGPLGRCLTLFADNSSCDESDSYGMVTVEGQECEGGAVRESAYSDWRQLPYPPLAGYPELDPGSRSTAADIAASATGYAAVRKSAARFDSFLVVMDGKGTVVTVGSADCGPQNDTVSSSITSDGQRYLWTYYCANGGSTLSAIASFWSTDGTQLATLTLPFSELSDLASTGTTFLVAGASRANGIATGELALIDPTLSISQVIAIPGASGAGPDSGHPPFTVAATGTGYLIAWVGTDGSLDTMTLSADGSAQSAPGQVALPSSSQLLAAASDGSDFLLAVSVSQTSGPLSFLHVSSTGALLGTYGSSIAGPDDYDGGQFGYPIAWGPRRLVFDGTRYLWFSPDLGTYPRDSSLYAFPVQGPGTPLLVAQFDPGPLQLEHPADVHYDYGICAISIAANMGGAPAGALGALALAWLTIRSTYSRRRRR